MRKRLFRHRKLLARLLPGAALAAGVAATAAGEEQDAQAPAPDPRPVVEIVTDLGPITVELRPDRAPQTVANFLIEYEDATERARALARMPGVEHHVWLEIGDLPRTFAHANDDLERTRDDKTAAVHFLRFELTGAQIAAIRAGRAVTFGIDHDELRCQATLANESVASLAADLATGTDGREEGRPQ